MNRPTDPTPSLKALLSQLDQLPDRFQEGVQKAILVADVDPEMALTRSRKELESVVREVYERRIQEPPGTRPLENLLQRLAKDGIFPDRISAYANAVRGLGNVGTHTFGEQITASDVHHSLTQLVEILRWYVKAEPASGTSPTPAPAEPAKIKTVPTGQPRRIAVVPKGLRSFDAKDAYFFLDLLPGPRHQDGLPESIRFWKHRIEATDELTFTVGVIYGPSGCGKSSLVKAGLLPQLDSSVAAVYVEATAADTEARLLKGLGKQCPALPGDADLAQTLRALRQAVRLGKERKVFIVLDQFEQWLHAKRAEENTELAQALRQCDGEHVQCVVLVRDDFWMGLTRFMQQLQIELVQGQNIYPVDLFDLAHARNVLSAFGQAFDKVSDPPSADHAEFINQAVGGLAQDGRLISVRLALFAEMVRGKRWVPATLKEVGGTEGVGITFLEETFSSARNRPYQKAARAVLKALLPEQGTDIKGNMQSQDKLLLVSGYASRPQDFEVLLRILDKEVLLITPTYPEDADTDYTTTTADKYYQLTHDYLVPSLREWLTRKQKETPTGRAELLLDDCTSLWTARKEDGPLPSFERWKEIVQYTSASNWTERQREMMHSANEYHALHWWQRLLHANTDALPTLLNEIGPFRSFFDDTFRRKFDQLPPNQGDPRLHLHASLALLPVDATQVPYLYGRLIDAEPQEFPVIRDLLAAHKAALVEKLWALVSNLDTGKEGQRLRAAAALAAYNPESQRWDAVSEAIANDVVKVPAVYLAVWLEAFRPLCRKLQAPLAAIFRDPRRRDVERSLATDILADYNADQPHVLAELLMDGDDNQFAVLFAKLKDHRDRCLALLTTEVGLPPPADNKPDLKEQQAKRQANAAVALLRFDQAEKVWPLLPHRPDPRVRSYLIHRLGPLGADAVTIINRLDEEPEVTSRRALILSLGEFGEPALPSVERGKLVEKMQHVYRTADDPGEHAAAEWLLRQWKREQWLRQTEDAWAKDEEQHEKRLDKKDRAVPQWYVNSQGKTMVVLPEPGVFWMGSPDTEGGRFEYEIRHQKRIGRRFALAAKPVTWAQFDEYYRDVFRKPYDARKTYTTDQCPANYIDWYMAAAYCNWLSRKDGLDEQQLCYEEPSPGTVTAVRAKYLSLTGYRLPTEAEMEYATRADVLTSRCYGETKELLPKYAWYEKNSDDHTWPVGSLKPNDFGMFDLHGNVWNWCQERYKDYPESTEVSDDVEDDDLVIASGRVMRGGAFIFPARMVRCACRYWNAPADRAITVGFRPARTCR